VTHRRPDDLDARHLFDKMPGEWWDTAACRGHDPDWFFPPLGSDALGLTRKGKAVCERCPSKRACLDFALTPPVEVHGLWGGLTSKERRGMALQRQRDLTNSKETT